MAKGTKRNETAYCIIFDILDFLDFFAMKKNKNSAIIFECEKDENNERNEKV